MSGELIGDSIKVKRPRVYPPTNIHILHMPTDDQTAYKYHPINKMITQINNFIYMTYKSKAAQSINTDLDYLRPEFRKLNIPIPPKQMQLTPSCIRTKEFLSQTKCQLMLQLSNIINECNDLFDPKAYEQSSSQQMKYFIGRGNNNLIVKAMLRQRFFANWIFKDRIVPNSPLDSLYTLEETSLDDCCFIWTQVKRQHIVEKLESHCKKMEDIKNASRLKFMQHLKKLANAGNDASNENEKKHQVPPIRLYGKLEGNYHLSNKKALFMNMKLYYEALGIDPFDVLPLTFHIKTGISDPEWTDFKNFFEETAKHYYCKNIWIVKPGENTNRGTGIQVCNSLKEIEVIINDTSTSSYYGYSTYIVQKYIERPLLIRKRKFDIRCYGLYTSVNGVQKGYFYNDGYIRTSCKEYNVGNLQNKFIHLTNDAIQKNSADYGKFESGNKMSFKEFQKYLDANYGSLSIDFYRDLFPQIKKLVQDTFRAVYGKLDPQKRLHGFEVFGYDFMIDEDFRIYLIEVNTNPCLETSCPLLARIISELLENTFKVGFDPLFYPSLINNFNSNTNNSLTPGQQALQEARQPDPTKAPNSAAQQQLGVNPIIKKQATISQSDVSITVIKYELVFDENIDGQFLRDKILTKTMAVVDNLYIQDDDEEELQKEANEKDIINTSIGFPNGGGITSFNQLMQIDEHEEDDDKMNTSTIIIDNAKAA